MSRPIIAATYWFTSSSGRGTYETLAYADGTTSCGCPGWTRRVDAAGRRSCKHTRMVEAGIGPANASKYHVSENATPTSVSASARGVTLQANRLITLPAVGLRKFTD